MCTDFIYFTFSFEKVETESHFPLTSDRQVQRGVHDSIAVVSDAGVNPLAFRGHIIQREGDVGRRVPQKLLVSKHPGDPGRRVAIHLTVQRHRAALHHLGGDVHPHGARSVYKGNRRSLTLNV